MENMPRQITTLSTLPNELFLHTMGWLVNIWYGDTNIGSSSLQMITYPLLTLVLVNKQFLQLVKILLNKVTPHQMYPTNSILSFPMHYAGSVELAEFAVSNGCNRMLLGNFTSNDRIAMVMIELLIKRSALRDKCMDTFRWLCITFPTHVQSLRDDIAGIAFLGKLAVLQYLHVQTPFLLSIEEKTKIMEFATLGGQLPVLKWVHALDGLGHPIPPCVKQIAIKKKQSVILSWVNSMPDN